MRPTHRNLRHAARLSPIPACHARRQPPGVASSAVSWIARACAAAVAALAIASASGCAFIEAGQKSVQKPNTFILLGHADVTLPASDRSTVGTTCIAPPQVHDIGPETPVTVRDGSGAKIAAGVLGTGIAARSGSTTTCAFPFQVSAVP